MMEFLVEIVITAFAFGGILGAVVALHLSANLKQADTPRISIDLPRSDEPQQPAPVPVKIPANRRPQKNVWR